MKRFILLVFAVFLCGVSVLAETPQEIEKTLVKNLQEVQKYSNYGENYDDEKLYEANRVLEANILKFTKTADTLKYGFPELSKLMFIETSDDGKFRVYSWDSETGGTMHDYYRLYQFIGTDGKIYSKGEDNSEEDGGAGSFVHDVFDLKTKSGMIYIVCSTFIGSTNDHYQSASLMKVKGSNIEDVEIIKTKEGLTNSLSFEYNFFSVVDRKERPIRLIKFDKKTNTLSIPVVIETEEFPNGQVTNRFLKYKFNGKNFVYVK